MSNKVATKRYIFFSSLLIKKDSHFIISVIKYTESQELFASKLQTLAELQRFHFGIRTVGEKGEHAQKAKNDLIKPCHQWE